MRSLVKTGHKVVSGNGEDSSEHYVDNETTGEVKWVTDNGFNYLIIYYTAPMSAAGFAGPAPVA